MMPTIYYLLWNVTSGEEKKKKLKGAMPARLIELGADWMMNRPRCCSPFHRNHQIG
jgi:hypothetical protein